MRLKERRVIRVLRSNLFVCYHLLSVTQDRTSSNVTTVKISYPEGQFEPDDAFPLGAPRSSSPPLRGDADTQIANAVHGARLVTSLRSYLTTQRLSMHRYFEVVHPGYHF